MCSKTLPIDDFFNFQRKILSKIGNNFNDSSKFFTLFNWFNLIITTSLAISIFCFAMKNMKNVEESTEALTPFFTGLLTTIKHILFNSHKHELEKIFLQLKELTAKSK